MPPEAMRAVSLEIFYTTPARLRPGSVPHFFGCRTVARPYHSQLTSAQEGRGFNAWLPLPFRKRIRIELRNGSARRFPFYYQVSYTLGAEPSDTGLLHASFRRENPTTLKRDFVIAAGLRGPGRFPAATRVRVLQDAISPGTARAR